MSHRQNAIGRNLGHLTDLADLDPFLRLREVETSVGLSKTAIYRRIAEGTFPAPRQLGGGQVRWPLSVIRAWKEGRPVGVAKPTAQ